MADQSQLSLQAILRDVLGKYYRSQRALANDLGMSESRFGKVLKAKTGSQNESFTVDRCLTLAKIASLPPSVVLKAAGKPAVATLIEELYNGERKAAPRPAFNDRQKTLLEHFDQLDVERQDKFITVLRDLWLISAGTQAPRRGRKASKKGR